MTVIAREPVGIFSAPRSLGVSLSALIVVLAMAVTVTAAGDLRLIEAVKTRNAETVRSLLEQRVDVNARQGDGATALHWAVHLDDGNVIDLLLWAGANADASDDTGVTPLYLACLNRQAALVERLLQAQANPNAATVSGETVLMTCARTHTSRLARARACHENGLATDGRSVRVGLRLQKPLDQRRLSIQTCEI